MKLHLFALVGTISLLGFSACRQEREGVSTERRAQDQTEPARQASMVEVPAMRDLDEGPREHVIYRPNEVRWQNGPASFEAGAQFSVLDGDPGASGVFTMQIKMPDGFVINPHWHPNVERVTVLKGTFHLGSGEAVNKEAAQALPQGTYTSMPKKMVHHAIAEGETIVQLTSAGPWEIHYVKPEHDPRLRDRER
jgi:hypothetical protein